MPAWAAYGGKMYRVAIIGVEHEDETYVEWLEGPLHEQRSYVRNSCVVKVEASDATA